MESIISLSHDLTSIQFSISCIKSREQLLEAALYGPARKSRRCTIEAVLSGLDGHFITEEEERDCGLFLT